MNSVEQYRKRFFKLMESTMGDVRPIINEQPNNRPMSDTQYFMSKVVVSDTQAILDKFKGKTMYLYNNEDVICKNEGGKNVVYMEWGAPAEISKYTVGVPAKISNIKLVTEVKEGNEVPQILNNQLFVYVELNYMWDMVKDESGGAPLVHYGTEGEQTFNKFDAEDNVQKGQAGTGMVVLDMSYDLTTKKWSPREGGTPYYQPCLLNSIQTALPNGLKYPERTDTDFGYNPGQDNISRA